MLHVSEQAAEVLRETLDRTGVRDQEGLRLTLDDGGQWQLEIDTPKEEDHVIWMKDSILVMVEPEIEHSMGDGLIDLQEDIAGLRLVLRRKFD